MSIYNSSLDEKQSDQVNKHRRKQHKPTVHNTTTIEQNSTTNLTTAAPNQTLLQLNQPLKEHETSQLPPLPPQSPLTQQINIPQSLLDSYNQKVVDLTKQIFQFDLAKMGSESDCNDHFKSLLLHTLPKHCTDAMCLDPSLALPSTDTSATNTIDEIVLLTGDKNPLLHSLTTLALSAIFFFSIIGWIVLPLLWRVHSFIGLSAVFHLNEYINLSIHHPNDIHYRHFGLGKKAIWYGRLFVLFDHFSTAALCRGYVSTSSNSFALYNIHFLENGVDSGFVLSFISLCGLGLLSIGLILRGMAVYQAGVNFQYDLQTTKQSHSTLVTTGLYSLVRHPSYTAMMIGNFGQALLMLSPIGLVVQFLTFYPLFLSRIALEEKYLVDMFGEAYIRYREHTPAFFPSLYSLSTYTDED